MRKNNGFTLIEIMVVLIIIGITAAIAFFMYKKPIEKAKAGEAIIAAGNIRTTQIARKLETGNYVPAENTEKINEVLGLGILSKDFEYRVVGVTDDNFLILAHRVNDDIKAGKFSPETIVVAMDKDGMVNYPGTGGGIGGAGGTGGAGGSGGTGGSGGGFGGGGISGGGGGGSGGGGTGGGGDTGDTGGGGTSGGSASLPQSGGGWSNLAATGGSGAAIDSGLQSAVELLKISTTSSYAYTLIEAKQITVTFAALTGGAAAEWRSWLNTILVDNSYKDGLTSAIAALIAHEATHADYDYYPTFWINTTLSRHPELTAAQIHIPGNSVNQEYDCFCNQMLAWKELKNGPDSNNDGWMIVYKQGEDVMRSDIKSTYAAHGINLPDY